MRFEKKRCVRTLVDMLVYYHLDDIVKDIDKVDETRLYPYHDYKEQSYIYFNAKDVNDLYAACKYIKEFMTFSPTPVDDAPKGIPIHHLKRFIGLVDYCDVSVSPKRRIKGKDPLIVIKFKGSIKVNGRNVLYKFIDYDGLTCLDDGLNFSYSKRYIDITRSFSDIPDEELKNLLPLFKKFMQGQITKPIKASPEWWMGFIHAMGIIKRCSRNPIVAFSEKSRTLRVTLKDTN